jgi:hypothetical protein
MATSRPTVAQQAVTERAAAVTWHASGCSLAACPVVQDGATLQPTTQPSVAETIATLVRSRDVGLGLVGQREKTTLIHGIHSGYVIRVRATPRQTITSVVERLA